MKSLAGGGLIGGRSRWGRLRGQDRPSMIPGRLSISEAHQFALSQPVASLVAGHDSVEQLEENIATTRNAESLSEAQREALVSRVADIASRGLNEHYKG